MRSIIQKIQTTLLAMGLIGWVIFALSGTALAGVNSNVSCADGSNKLSITSSKTAYTTTVACSSKSKISYTDGKTPIGLTVTCAGANQDVGGDTTGSAPASGTSLVFYCEVISGAKDNFVATRTHTIPVANQVAATITKCPDGSVAPNGNASNCPTNSDPAITSGNCATAAKCDLMTQYIYPFINLLAAFVGVAVVISMIIGGIQYGSSAGDPQKVSAAKNRIRNAIIALVTFIFLYALLNFLVPGGLFK